MAKIIKNKSDLIEKRNQTVGIHLVGYVLNVGCGVGFLELLFASIYVMNFKTGRILELVLLFVLSITGIFLIHFTRDYVGILNAGVGGEKNALNALAAALPNSYSVVNNVVVWFENRHNELDLVVVGPTGVFIVEIKNTAGHIVGNYADPKLQQVKKKETKEMRNPVAQVRTHTDILARFLKANDIRCWVQSTVFFVNPKCTPEIAGIPSDGVQVFAVSENGVARLAAYIQSSRQALTQQEMEKVIGLLSNH